MQSATLSLKMWGKPGLRVLAIKVLTNARGTDFYLENAHRFLKPCSVRGGLLLLLNEYGRIYRKPFGVIGIITP